MRINSGVTSGIGAVRSKGDVAAANSSSRVAGAGEINDVVSVSATAQMVNEIRHKLDELPNIRASKIGAIQNQFDTNTYHPDSEAVVDGLLREHMRKSAS